MDTAMDTPSSFDTHCSSNNIKMTQSNKTRTFQADENEWVGWKIFVPPSANDGGVSQKFPAEVIYFAAHTTRTAPIALQHGGPTASCAASERIC